MGGRGQRLWQRNIDRLSQACIALHLWRWGAWSHNGISASSDALPCHTVFVASAPHLLGTSIHSLVVTMRQISNVASVLDTAAPCAGTTRKWLRSPIRNLDWWGTHESVSPHPTWSNDIEDPRSIQAIRTIPCHVPARACLPDDGIVCIPFELLPSARRSTYARECEMRLSSFEPVRLATIIQGCYSACTRRLNPSHYSPPFALCRHDGQGCVAPRHDHDHLQVPLLLAPRYDHTTFLCFHRSFCRRIEKKLPIIGFSVVPTVVSGCNYGARVCWCCGIMSRHKRTRISHYIF